jgi:enterochelin esterase-like enzyme
MLVLRPGGRRRPAMRRAAIGAATTAAVLAVCAPAAGSGPLRGTIAYGSFDSKALRGADHYAIYLPPGYDRSRQRYPVVYFLHGLPASATAYRSIGVIAQAVETSGRRAIVVGAQGARGGDDDPEWLDRGPGRRWETATAVELVAIVDRRYRTLASRRGRILVGISAGGYGATLIAAHHPATYSVIESWSGYFHATDPSGTRALDLGSREANDWASFHALIPSLKRRFAPYLRTTWYGFYVGTDDARFRRENEQVDRELHAAGIPHVFFRLYAGGHSWSLWRRHAAAWIGGALAAAARPSS